MLAMYRSRYGGAEAVRAIDARGRRANCARTRSWAVGVDARACGSDTTICGLLTPKRKRLLAVVGVLIAVAEC
jgi:hypothetical protein